MNVRSSVTLACFVLVAAACGGGQPEAVAPSSPADAAPPPPPLATTAPEAVPDAAAAAPVAAAPVDAGPPADAAPAQKAWADLTKDERLTLMKTVVLPKMKTAFQGLDAKKFADFSCKTCHGEGAKLGKFDMPNPKLPKLDPKDSFKKDMDKHPDITKFMMQTVTPQMADLLNTPHYDPATHQGFGCFNCHTMAK
jgi:hypothetical protein